MIVFNPFGDNEDGFVDRNLTYKDIPLPAGVDENKYYQEFEDGTVYIHDTKEKQITLTTPLKIKLHSKDDIELHSEKTLTLKGANIEFRKSK